MGTPSLFPIFMLGGSGSGSGLLGLIDAEIGSDLFAEVSVVTLTADIASLIETEVGSSPLQASLSSPIVVEVGDSPILTEVC